MHSFKELSQLFEENFNIPHFPKYPESLYAAAQYILTLRGKRIRPVMCLMGNELFDTINPDAWYVASAIELFHNFTLIHDDIMDNAPLRRGKDTVHVKYNESTALLAGDILLLRTYEYLNEAKLNHVQHLIRILNKTGKEICEGQQMDMDFEKLTSISLDQYMNMIELKTAV